MRILVCLLALTSVLGLYGCAEDFTVAAPYRQITVVAGILDRKDSAHYIRIEKAFMDETKSAIEMSKEPDSSFYKNLQVKMYQYSTDQKSVLDSVSLYRVDMNNEGAAYRKLEPLDEQQFFTAPNYAYKFKNTDWTKQDSLRSSSWYRLVITNLDNNTVDSSDFVGIVNSDSNRANDGFFIPSFIQSSYTVAFTRTVNNSRYTLFAYMPRHGRIAQGYIRFHYVEENAVTNEVVRKHVDYAFDDEQNVSRGGVSFELSILNSSIYGFLNSAIGLLPANTIRYLDSCDLFVYAASPELYYYNIINQGQRGGLTGDNIQPNYTNFTSDRVIGILGSRGMRAYYNAAIDKTTVDSIMINPVTKDLGIRGISKD